MMFRLEDAWLRRWWKPAFCFVLLLIGFSLFATTTDAATIVTYPAPSTETANANYAVKVDTSNLFVYDTKVRSAASGHMGFASFDFSSGPVTITVTTNFDITSGVVIRPLAAGITPTVSGRTITFSVSNPVNLSIEVNGDIDNNLALFANPIETAAPQDNGASNVLYMDPGTHSSNINWGTKDTLYFRPGVHRLTETLIIPSGKNVYLAGGAVVQTRVATYDASNVRIFGRGIIDGTNAPQVYDWGDHRSSFFYFVRSDHIDVEGIILRSSPGFHMVPVESEYVNIKNIKSIGATISNKDGYDIVDSRYVTIDGIFIRTVDDAIAIKGSYKIAGQRGESSYITVKNSTFWNEDQGNSMEIGFEESTDQIRYITFQNIDIIHTRSGSVISIHNGDSAHIHDVLYDNIRIEDVQTSRFIDMAIDYYTYSADLERGEISNITFNNINYIPATIKGSQMKGYDTAHNVDNIKFYNLKMGGTTITSASQMSLTLLPYVTNVLFSSSPAAISPWPNVTLPPGKPMPMIWEGEKRAPVCSTGDSQTAVADANASLGKYGQVLFNAANDYCDYFTLAAFPGEYDVYLGTHKSDTRGIFQFTMNGMNVGSPFSINDVTTDYSSTVGEVKVGTAYIHQSRNNFRFTVVGQLGGSSDYALGFDYIKLVPRFTEATKTLKYEAEEQPYTATTGKVLTIGRNVNASNNAYTSVNTSAAGQYVEYSIHVPESRTYAVKARVHNYGSRGKYRLSIDGGAEQGLEIDGANPSAAYLEYFLGYNALAAGDHTFRFTVTGKNPSSTGYSIGLDFISLEYIPGLPASLLEVETLPAAASAGRTVSTVSHSGASGGAFSTVNTATVGEWVEYSFYVAEGGAYTLKSRMNKWPSRAIVQPYVDGTSIGTTIDLYSPSTAWQEYTLGVRWLTAGTHKVRFLVTGKNASSSGYVIATDSFQLVP
ncbi:glycosyl hydrolase family 28 protein [Paenibacillus roseipurpureus]|uniref:Glycosyl hydrolase family 28 protein n=1 Tax=Paenibacillus roseopurpureus TaxID=2918901 RepID=A0AA96LTF7_9BACL|nr:glycosyl hydrolase family 28 protein [Paenibacillus sp. MBLB1832]WNR45673.1 glycosyl hydrolase family 28 protein [Paenibacillus sp. MBLB1832]